MSLINLSICLSDIPKDKIKLGKDDKKYINLICARRKEKDNFENTHTIFVSQTKEERERQAAKNYVGNGKEYDPQPQAVTAADIEQMPVAPIDDPADDLPF